MTTKLVSQIAEGMQRLPQTHNADGTLVKGTIQLTPAQKENAERLATLIQKVETSIAQRKVDPTGQLYKLSETDALALKFYQRKLEVLKSAPVVQNPVEILAQRMMYVAAGTMALRSLWNPGTAALVQTALTTVGALAKDAWTYCSVLATSKLEKAQDDATYYSVLKTSRLEIIQKEVPPIAKEVVEYYAEKALEKLPAAIVFVQTVAKPVGIGLATLSTLFGGFKIAKAVNKSRAARKEAEAAEAAKVVSEQVVRKITNNVLQAAKDRETQAELDELTATRYSNMPAAAKVSANLVASTDQAKRAHVANKPQKVVRLSSWEEADIQEDIRATVTARSAKREAAAKPKSILKRPVVGAGRCLEALAFNALAANAKKVHFAEPEVAPIVTLEPTEKVGPVGKLKGWTDGLFSNVGDSTMPSARLLGR